MKNITIIQKVSRLSGRLLRAAPVMINALYGTRNKEEALLILNSIVLMKDGFSGYSFDIQPEKMATSVREDALVSSRLAYLELL